MTIKIGDPPVAATSAQLAQLRTDLGGTQYASMSLTATATGKRQALGASVSVKFTAAGAGSIYAKFVDASGAIAVSSSDLNVDCNAATPVQIAVPSGYPFLEYLRVGGSDVTFTLNLLA